MTTPVVTGRRTALSATAVCLVSVLFLLGVNLWLSVALAAALGVVWSIAEIVVDKIRRRKGPRGYDELD
jgi:ascorbate-specific PTS system EIIC-type component UlaA